VNPLIPAFGNSDYIHIVPHGDLRDGRGGDRGDVELGCPVGAVESAVPDAWSPLEPFQTMCSFPLNAVMDGPMSVNTGAGTVHCGLIQERLMMLFVSV